MRIRPIHSLLVFSGIAIAISASSAVHVLAGRGTDVLAFSLGAGFGLGWSCFVGLSNWIEYTQRLEESGAIALYFLLKSLSLDRDEASSRPHRSAEVIIPEVISPEPEKASISAYLAREIEVRELLDAVCLLIEFVVDDEGYCGCCGCNTREDDHSADCNYRLAYDLFKQGVESRPSWEEFADRYQL